MKQKLENNAEYQRRRTWSQDERNIAARDEVAQSIHKQNQVDGKNSSFDEAQRKATDLAHRLLRQEQDAGRKRK